MADGMADTQMLKELQETILKLRKMGGPSMARTNTAERLSQLTEKIDPKEVDDKTLDDLVSLLDSPDDSVRFWVAASIGHLGPRAKGAAPALLKILHETECLELKEMTSAGAARVALKRIGVTPPPRDCVKKSD
jgi:hypothetical protein